MSGDPFDTGVERNGHGQPLIVPLKRGKPDTAAKLVPYTRASTFAKALDDGGGLATWRTRHAAHGVAKSPDLAAMIAALGNPDMLASQAKRDLDGIIERAHDRSGGNIKADYGTAVHSLTEPGNTGDPFDAGIADDVAAYNAALDGAGLTVVDSERFVVNDRLAVAGTYDHRYEAGRDLIVPVSDDCEPITAGTRLLGDKKTGTLHPLSCAIQLAVYARAELYDHTTGVRTALDVSPQWGVVAHIPRGTGTATLYLVDLHAGWEAAKLALAVRQARSGEKRLVVSFAETRATRLGTVDDNTTDAATVNNDTVTAEPDVTEPAATPAPTATKRRTVELPGTLGGDDRLPEPADEIIAARNADVTEPAATPAPTPEQVEQAALDAIRDTFPDSRVDALLDLIAAAPDRDTCADLWRINKHIWTDAHTAAVTARITQLADAA